MDNVLTNLIYLKFKSLPINNNEFNNKVFFPKLKNLITIKSKYVRIFN